MAIGAERGDVNANAGTGRTGGQRLPSNFSDLIQNFASEAQAAGPALPGPGANRSNSSVGNSQGGGLNALFGASNDAIRESVDTGFQGDIAKQFSALAGSAFGEFDRQQAQLLDRQSGLGTRFSTDTSRLQSDANREFTGNILQQILPSFLQSAEGSANRRQDAIFRGVPGILGASGAAGQADLQGRQAPTANAVGFGAGFAPVGAQSKQKGGGINLATNAS